MCCAVLLEFFGKPSSELTLQDIESFELALSKGDVHTRLGRDSSNATKVEHSPSFESISAVVIRPPGCKRTGGLWLDSRQVKEDARLSE